MQKSVLLNEHWSHLYELMRNLQQNMMFKNHFSYILYRYVFKLFLSFAITVGWGDLRAFVDHHNGSMDLPCSLI